MWFRGDWFPYCSMSWLLHVDMWMNDTESQIYERAVVILCQLKGPWCKKKTKKFENHCPKEHNYNFTSRSRLCAWTKMDHHTLWGRVSWIPLQWPSVGQLPVVNKQLVIGVDGEAWKHWVCDTEGWRASSPRRSVLLTVDTLDRSHRLSVCHSSTETNFIMSQPSTPYSW